MAKTQNESSAEVLTPVATPVAAPVDAPVSLTLTEFCSRLSETVRSPELIAGFEFNERMAGRVQSDAVQFRARFDEFVNKPI